MIRIAPLKPLQAQQCGTCQHWHGSRVRLPYSWGLCSVIDRQTTYHAGGMCQDYEASAKESPGQ